MRTSDPITGSEALDADIQRLRDDGYDVDVLVEGGQVGVVIMSFELPPGVYNRRTTDILLRTDLQYPMSAMDMFWVDDALLLASGAEPAGANSLEAHFGRTWRRYSWHRNAPWEPARDDLPSHFEFCVARLQRPE